MKPKDLKPRLFFAKRAVKKYEIMTRPIILFPKKIEEYFLPGELYQASKNIVFFNIEKRKEVISIKQDEFFFILDKSTSFILVLSKKEMGWVDTISTELFDNFTSFYKRIK
jgi:hypothetical protein